VCQLVNKKCSTSFDARCNHEVYRGITLLNVTYRVFSNILYTRLLPHVQSKLGHYQAGFCTGKSTIKQIVGLQQILEKWKRCDRELEELYNEPNIVNIIKSSRLRWAGHAVLMDDNELP